MAARAVKPRSASTVRQKPTVSTNRPHTSSSISDVSPSKGIHNKQKVYNKPSARLNPKTGDPFSKKIPKSVFAAEYTKGDIPCRLNHGSVKHKIEWTKPVESLHYDPILVLFAEGLKEMEFPHSFIAREGFMQLLQVKDAGKKTIPVLPKLITPLKGAMLVNNEECFRCTLDALVQLSEVVGTALNKHLNSLLPQISRKFSNSRASKDKITNALQMIEMNGGPECTPIIKSRIPTYASVL